MRFFLRLIHDQRFLQPFGRGLDLSYLSLHVGEPEKQAHHQLLQLLSRVHRPVLERLLW